MIGFEKMPVVSFLSKRLPRSVLLAAFIAIWGAESAAFAAPTVIGHEAVISLPATALWNGIINLRPGTNETVTLNPPLFSWFYAPGSPTNCAYDKNVYKFQFQASYSSDFTSLIFDINTFSCVYNFVKPFTNSPVYWRVAYLDTNSPPTTNFAQHALNASWWTNNNWGTNPAALSPDEETRGLCISSVAFVWSMTGD